MYKESNPILFSYFPARTRIARLTTLVVRKTRMSAVGAFRSKYSDVGWHMGQSVFPSYDSDGQDGIKVYIFPIELMRTPKVYVGRR